MSIKDHLAMIFIKNGMIEWIIKLLERSLLTEIHIYSLDFASALLANILHSNKTLDYLEKELLLAKTVMEKLLMLIRSRIPISVLMHVLISLSYLNKERFSLVLEECRFVQRIEEFVERFSREKMGDCDEMDKRTVLDLCAYMFQPKDVLGDSSDFLQSHEAKFEDKAREFENEQSHINFESFPDELQ